MSALSLVWDLLVRDQASPGFNRVATSAERAAASTDRASGATRRAADSQTRAARAGSVFNKSLGLIGIGAVVGAGAIAKVIGEASKYQSSMLLLQTQAGASAVEVSKMSSAVLSLSGSVATSPQKLADALYHVESTGLRGAQALNVLRIAAEGAKVGNTDLVGTTNSLTSAVASGIKGVQNIGQAMGALNAIVGSGDMSWSNLNDALSTGILTKAKSYGLNLRDVGAALATFGDLNIRGADAATDLRMAFEAFAKPAAGGLATLKKLGVGATELRSDLQQGGLNKAVLDLTSHLTAAGVTGDRVGGVLLDAFGKKGAGGATLLINNLARFESKYPQLTKGATGFGAAWTATTKTAAFAFSQLGANLEAIGIRIGTAIIPTV